MRGPSQQGYRGRRGCGGYADKAVGKVHLGSIWEVVSTLAQALTDARDQLVGLMSLNQGINGGGQKMHGNASPQRCYSPSAGSSVRNLHRQHAHGHVAFGLNTEHRQYASRTRSPQTYSGGAGHCQHRLHSMSPTRRSPRQSPKRSRGMSVGVQLSNDNNLHIDSRMGKMQGGGGPVNICFSSGGSSGCGSKPPSRSASPEKKRHCIGTQYAALLKEEAYQMRERRLAEENKLKRPKWSRS